MKAQKQKSSYKYSKKGILSTKQLQICPVKMM